MTVIGDQTDESGGRRIRILTNIHILEELIQYVLIQDEVVLHTSTLLEGIQILAELSESLVKETRKTSLDLTLFIHL